MEIALTIMIAQGILGAFDTLYYHEYRYQLPVHGPKVRRELRCHAARDFVYGVLFLTLPFLTWQGTLAVLLVLFIATEICITIWDFNIEVIERADIGGVANEERGLHLIMAVVYGFFLAHLIPHLWSWYHLPLGFGLQSGVPSWIVAVCVVFGVGVVLSGVRDLLASTGMRGFQKDLFGRDEAPSSHEIPDPRTVHADLSSTPRELVPTTSTTENHRIALRLESGEISEVSLEAEWLASGGCVLKCRNSTFPLYAEESDFFTALQVLRKSLEGRSVQLLCNGSRLEVWPSSMSREMGGGRKAHVCRIGEEVTEVVDIFESASTLEYSTVDEQKSYHERRIRNLKSKK